MVVLAGVCAGVVAIGYAWRWTHDDGFITFRVVEQVFAGNGPVFNQGERVEAFTSPAHVALLCLLRLATFGRIDVAVLSAASTLAAAGAGLWWAGRGAATLARRAGQRGPCLPVGVLVLAALAPTWEFATSGLETGLVLAWIGASFAALAALADAEGRASRPRVMAVAVLVGLGPLVRPELGIVTVVLLAALLGFRARSGRSAWSVISAACALPVAYQIFRMGYYASLVPNTALAKEAAGARWGQGWRYLVNTVGPYGLVVPLAAMAGWAALLLRRAPVRAFGGAEGRHLAAAAAVSGLLSAGYVVRLGGDYMHARMLLPPIFLVCCPLASAPIPTARSLRAPAAALFIVVGGWAAIAAFALRPPAPTGFFDGGSIADQRVFFIDFAGDDHPVTLEDWRRSAPVQRADQVRRGIGGSGALIVDAPSLDGRWPAWTPLVPAAGTTVVLDGIGAAGLALGVDVHVIDVHGLAHPIASRLPIEQPRRLPGHEKVLPLPWILAEAGLPSDDQRVRAAVDAWRCGPLRELSRAVHANLTPARFVRNVLAAPSLTLLDVPEDPRAALDRCER